MAHEYTLPAQLRHMRKQYNEWVEKHPEESKLSIVCIHILFPVEKNQKTNAIKMKFKSLTEMQARICNGLMYLCDGCALLFDNIKFNPAMTGNYQLVKWRDFYRNIDKITER